MICPFCGNEIPDEHIYCDVCGKEFQIVPDYDYEVEEKISKSIDYIKQDVIEEKERNQSEQQFEDDEEYFLEEDPNLLESVVKHFRGRKVARITFFLVCVVLVLFVSGVIIRTVRVNSSEYLYEHAIEAIDKGNYGQATDYLDRLLLKDSSNIEHKMLLANCYMKSENYESAILTLQEIISQDPTYIEAYQKIISIYEQNKEYDKINRLFEQCENEEVLKSFQSYVAFEPEFSVEEGEYNEMVVLKLSANANGNIYYTLDGSVPDTTSSVYTAPITLEQSGIYVISAVFINDYGVKSDIVTHKYTIDLIEPEAPEVSLESGKYDVPQLITIDVPEYHTVYYTIDGDVPNDTSSVYSGPMWLQLGTHVYQFITYNQSGIPGEVSSYYYTLSMNTLYSAEKALESSRVFLVNYGFIKDVEGHVEGKTGVNEYSCTQAFIFQETPYYLIVEKYVDTLGTAVSTGNLWAFDANDTRFYRAFAEKDGTYRVEPILDF